MKLTKKLGVIAAAVVAMQTDTSAVIFNFQNVAVQTPNYASQLSVDVTAFSATVVEFKFMNTGPNAGQIQGISFQDLGNSLSAPMSLFDSFGANVVFVSGGGAKIPNSISFTEDLAFELKNATGSGSSINGIDPGEWLAVRITGGYANVLADLNSGKIDIGLHVQKISNWNNGGSQKFILQDAPTTVPDGGATVALLGLGSLALAALRRKA